MTIEDNKALVRRFVDEFWSNGNESAADELLGDGATIVVNGQTVEDSATLKGFARMLRSAFPDWRSELEELVGQDDRIAERWTGHGTHAGVFQGVQATGRQVAVPGTVFY